MSKHDRIRLRHMLEAAQVALLFTDGREREDLDQNMMLVFALVRAIEIVGEAASHITQECRDELPQIPWVNIIGMRNRLIHAYFDINLDILWATAKEDLPLLIVELKKIVDAEDN